MTTCPCGRASLGLAHCYWCAKLEVDWSKNPPASNGLSEDERQFIGLFRPRRYSNGWRQPDRLSILQPYGQDDTDEMWLSDEEQRLLAFLATSPDMEID